MPVDFEKRKTGLIVGIDLGTTNSLVAVVRDGLPVVLEARGGGKIVPSVVSFPSGGGGSPLVGLAAREGKVRDARSTVFSVKRLMGRGFDDLRSVAEELPYEIVAAGTSLGATTSPDGAGSASRDVRVRVHGREYTAIEISAMILRELKASAETALGEPVSQAVVTVPAYFNDSQRQATRAAGRLAGLDVLRILNEPTAASLAYGLDRKRQGLIAVYDLGGGTFDVSILRLHDGIFEVLATNGDTALGGDDLDLAVARVAGGELAAAWAVEPASVWSDAGLKAALIGGAERVKIELATAESAELVVRDGGREFSRRFTRDEFERIAMSVLDRTREPCLSALRDAGVRVEQLSDVVMVGGPTRLAVVQRVAREIFGREPNVSMHPDEVVAAGAAIQADILAGNNRELLLLDVVPLSLGLETYGGLMSPLIHRNTRVPAVARETFTTFVDNQTGVDIHVLQGERERVEDNRSLARFKLAGIEPQPAGLPRVEVTFLVDADGILQVAARDLRTGNQQTVEVRPSFGLTDAEVERMLQSSADHAEADVAYRQLVEVRNEAEPVLRASERAWPDAQRLLTPEEVSGIRVDMEALKNALAGSDSEAIRGASYRLGRSTSRLAELILTDTLNSSRS